MRSPVDHALAAARATLLDGDGPLIRLHSVNKRWCCLLCKRQFAEESKLGQHLLASEMHRSNVHAAQASGRLLADMLAPSLPKAPPPSTVHENQPTRKRSLEDDSRISSSRLKQMQEFEQALAAKARSSCCSESGAASMGDVGGQSAYRDRAKERREQAGGYAGLTATSDIRSARDINGNLDWKCGHCAKVNFAREIICINCAREVDEKTEYLDSSDFQRQRHEGMMKLAARNRVGEGQRPLS